MWHCRCSVAVIIGAVGSHAVALPGWLASRVLYCLGLMCCLPMCSGGGGMVVWSAWCTDGADSEGCTYELRLELPVSSSLAYRGSIRSIRCLHATSCARVHTQEPTVAKVKDVGGPDLPAAHGRCRGAHCFVAFWASHSLPRFCNVACRSHSTKASGLSFRYGILTSRCCRKISLLFKLYLPGCRTRDRRLGRDERQGRHRHLAPTRL